MGALKNPRACGSTSLFNPNGIDLGSLAAQKQMSLSGRFTAHFYGGTKSGFQAHVVLASAILCTP